MRRISLLATTVLLLALVGCGDDEQTANDQTGSGSGSATASEDTLTGALTVFAAASLTDVFTSLGEQFEAEHPDVTVVDNFNFAGSSTLAEGIVQAAPADVFASASPTTMQTVVDAGLNAEEPTIFVQNTLQIAVPAGNPAGVTGLEDFTNPELTIALCAEDVPCGTAAIKVFEAAGLTPQPDTLESDVRAALTKVELGEVDAALVYKTDVLVSGDAVEGIDFPESADAVNDYLITTLTDAPNPDAAAAWVEFVLSEVGLAAFEEAGFQLP
ncbi:MAG: molybdate ABC transporter substrate-binding protein [Geodermatophilaceae bacterium]|nr:molybdate ABC transporter substrate-binding protein [Geodermatophilaceae bacterium]